MADRIRTQTSTQIRTLYAEGQSYLNMKFYNTNFSFGFAPYIGQSQSGLSMYDKKQIQTTTVNFEGAYVLWKAAKDILEGTIQEIHLDVPGTSGNASCLMLDRKLNQDGKYETTFTFHKSQVSIPFTFSTTTQQVKRNGQVVTEVVESGLGVFCKTIEGYLTGINSDRHLDKLTEEYARLQEVAKNELGTPTTVQNTYKPNNNFKRPSTPYNKRPYQAQQQWNQNQVSTPPQEQPQNADGFQSYAVSN